MMDYQQEVDIAIAQHIRLGATLTPSDAAHGIVLFAHGAGSSRFSPRNRFVASVLARAGLASILMDLLTPEEEDEERFTRHLRFDIELLAGRLVEATHWLLNQPWSGGLAIGYFGSSTGAAAALVAAARVPDEIAAVVSRGGRPDLAGEALELVSAPTLLIVGGADYGVIELNEEALERLRTEKRLEIVPGATHLFEEAGALERVAELATGWFVEHLKRPRPLEHLPAQPRHPGDGAGLHGNDA